MLAAVGAACVLGAAAPASARFAAAVIAAGAVTLVVRKPPAVRVAGLASVCFGIALAATASRNETGAIEHIARAVPQCSIEGSITERTAFGAVMRVAIVACAGLTPVADPGAVLLETDAPPGSFVRGQGWLVPLPALPRGQVPPYVGASLESTADTSRVRAPTGIHGWADGVRRGLAHATEDLPRVPQQLIAGLVLGDRDGLPHDVVARFRRAGLSHILAVSGSNVAIVVGCVLAVASRARLMVRVVAASGALLLFVATVGPEPSVLRAALVGTAALAALAAGMKTRPLHVLSLATIVLLVARPWLVFAPGLHLSVAATAGILLWTRPLLRSMRALPRPLGAVVAVTLAAQAAVAPITIATFGEVSVVAPVANALALPAVAPATLLGMAAGLAGTVAPAASRLVARAALPFAQWVLAVGDNAGRWEWASLQPDPVWAVAVSIPVLGLAAWALKRGSIG